MREQFYGLTCPPPGGRSQPAALCRCCIPAWQWRRRRSSHAGQQHASRATSLQQRGPKHTQAGQRCFCSTVLTLQDRLVALAVPQNWRKCRKQTWKVVGRLISLPLINGMKWSPGVTITRVPTCHLRVQANAGAQDCGDTVTDLQTRCTLKKTRIRTKRNHLLDVFTHHPQTRIRIIDLQRSHDSVSDFFFFFF